MANHNNKSETRVRLKDLLGSGIRSAEREFEESAQKKEFQSAPEAEENLPAIVPQSLPSVVEDETETTVKKFFSIEGTVKVSGETGGLTIDKIEDALAKSYTPPSIEMPPVNNDNFGFARSPGFKRPQDVLKDMAKIAGVQNCAFSIMENELGRIATAVTDSAKELSQGLESLAKDESHAATAEVQALMRELANIIISNNSSADEVILASKETSAALEDVNNVVEECKTLSGNLRKIAKQTSLLAINVSMEAKSSGDSDVTATQMRRIAKELAAFSDEMEDKTGKITSAIESGYALLKQVSYSNRPQSPDITDKTNKVTEIFSSLCQNIGQNAQASANLQNTASSLGGDMQYLSQMADILEILRVNSLQNQAIAIKSLGVIVTESEADKDLSAKILSSLEPNGLKEAFISFLRKEGHLQENLLEEEKETI